MHLYCGIDWATEHHDVAVVNDDGRVVARGRVDNDAAGFAELLTLLAEAGDTAEHPIPVAIETDRGLWIAALRATGRAIYPINPLAASRYRARHQVSGAKSDATDAVLLANILRTDPGAHRVLPADTKPPRRSGCWPAPSRTPCGHVNRSATKSGICSKTSTPRRWPRSPTCPRVDWPAATPAPSWRPHPLPPKPRS